MRSLDEAESSQARVTFTEEQRKRSQEAWGAGKVFLRELWRTANNKSSAELTLACRAIEEALMWHSKAISNEHKPSKDQPFQPL